LQRALTDVYRQLEPNPSKMDDHIASLAVLLTNMPVPPPGGNFYLTFKVGSNWLVDSLQGVMNNTLGLVEATCTGLMYRTLGF